MLHVTGYIISNRFTAISEHEHLNKGKTAEPMA